MNALGRSDGASACVILTRQFQQFLFDLAPEPLDCSDRLIKLLTDFGIPTHDRIVAARLSHTKLTLRRATSTKAGVDAFFQPGAPSMLQLVQNDGSWLIDGTNLVGSELERRPIIRLLRADPYNRALDRNCRRLVPAIQPLVATAFHVLSGGARPIPRNQAKVEFGALSALDSQANSEVTPLEQGSEAPGEWRAALDALAAQFSKPPKHPIALSVNQAARIAAAARKLIALAPRAGLPDCRPSVPEITR